MRRNWMTGFKASRIYLLVTGTFSSNTVTFSDRRSDFEQEPSTGPSIPQVQYLAILPSLAPNRRNTTTVLGGGLTDSPQNGCSSKYRLMATMVRFVPVQAEGHRNRVRAVEAATGSDTGWLVGCGLDMLAKASSSTFRACSIAAAVFALLRV
jgi:hypothetical protein